MIADPYIPPKVIERWKAQVVRRSHEAAAAPLDLVVPAATDDYPIVGAVASVNWIAPAARRAPEPWLIQAELHADGDRLVISKVTVEHLVDPSMEVTGYILHRVPAAQIRSIAASYLALQDPAITPALELVEQPGSAAAAKAAQARSLGAKQAARRRWAKQIAPQAHATLKRPGRRGHPPDFYRLVAHDALELSESGRRHNVVKVLAEQRGVPIQTVRDWIRRARKLGFLGPTQQGRSQWTAGPNLRKAEQDG